MATRRVRAGTSPGSRPDCAAEGFDEHLRGALGMWSHPCDHWPRGSTPVSPSSSS